MRAGGEGQPERADAHLVSGSYFRVLGVNAALGRVLQPTDDAVGVRRTAVISHRYWQARFHADRAVIGRDVVLNGTAFTIVGVAPPEFFGERVRTPPDYWVPLVFQAEVLQREPWLNARDVFWLNMLGRLKPGVSRRQASAIVTTQLQTLFLAEAGTTVSAATKRKIQEVHVELKPGGAGISGLRYLYSQPLHLLMAVVGVVLLIACANIATLLLARASKRSREFSARLALGASRGRLVRQVLTESLLLSAIGGAAGVAVAWWSVKGLTLLLNVDPVVKVRPDPLVLGFTLAISIATGILFGIVPALRFSNLEPRLGTALRAVPAGGFRFGSAQTLIVAQVALSFILLLGTGLLARSLLTLETQNLGYDRQNILIVHTDPHLAGYRKEELFALYREIDERLNRIPGVRSATLARYTPVSGSSSSGTFGIQGRSEAAGSKMNLHRVEVGPRFLETLGIPLRLGRAIGPLDTPASAPVAMVNQTFVDRYLPHQQPLGQRFSFGNPFQAPGFEIVGVVADSKYYDLRVEPEPMAFVAAWQLRGDDAYAGDLILRTPLASAAVMPEVRRVLKTIGERLTVLGFTTLDHEIDESLAQEKMVTSLCSVFGLAALLLSCIGIYGTVAYAVSRRTTEIGIRMAIGAQRRTVLWMVLRESVMLTGAGLVLGVPLALIAMRWIRSFLYGVPIGDPLAIAGSLLVIAAASILAAYLPAYRATKIDPMIALRYE